MSLDRLARLYSALPPEWGRALDVPIGKTLGSRPESVPRRPEALRVKALRAYLLRSRDDAVAADLLRAYFLGARKALVVGFLEATSVPHKDGQVEGDEEPALDQVPRAVAALLERHEREDVLLYLRIAALQWPSNAAVAHALAEMFAAPGGDAIVAR